MLSQNGCKGQGASLSHLASPNAHSSAPRAPWPSKTSTTSVMGRRKASRRHIGHKQHYLTVRITAIEA